MAFLNLNLLSSVTAAFWRMAFPLVSAQNPNEIQLLEPIGDHTGIPTDGGPLGALGFYVGLLYPWILGMAAAWAVLLGVWGGIEMMQAGGDQTGYDKGKKYLLSSLGGLLVVLLSGTILRTLNPSFFR